MTLTFLELMALVALGFVGSILTLVGVCIGGYLVYATKRDDGSTLITPFSRPEGDAYVAKGDKLDDADDLPLGTDAGQTYDKLLTDMNARFRGQIGDVR